jgi:hypothetical protein
MAGILRRSVVLGFFAGVEVNLEITSGDDSLDAKVSKHFVGSRLVVGHSVQVRAIMSLERETCPQLCQPDGSRGPGSNHGDSGRF